MIKKLLINLAILLLLPAIILAQISPENVETDSSKTVEITLLNNSRLYGQILSVSSAELELRQEDGRIFVELSRIRSIREIDLTRRGAQWFENPNYSRLFFSPTARPLQKGDGYYQNIYVFFNNVAYAVSDNIAFTGGFTLIPTVSLVDQLYFFTGKFGMEVSENNFIGAGVGVAAADSFNSGLFLGYANYTRAFYRGSLTGGIAGFSANAEAGTYAFYFGGDYRLFERVSFVSENYLFPEADDPFGISYGVRIMGQRMSFDLAYFRPGLGSDVGFGIPYVDVVVNF